MIPQRLKPGDTIGIISPSNPIKEERKVYLENAARKFEQLGLKVVYPQNRFKVDKYGVSGGEPEERAYDLNAMFANPEINAIYCAQGGETANQILPLIDYENIKQNPKLFIGMSDIDILHLAINTKTGLIVFNGCDPKSGRGINLDFDYSWENFQNRLVQGSKEIKASSERKCVRKGIAEGRIVGCNLSSILKLAGTEYFPVFNNSILFLEAYAEDVRDAIWKLEMLKQLEVFTKVKGLVIGYIYGFQDPERRVKNKITYEFENIALDITKDYSFPILKTNDFGHDCPNCFLPIGARVSMDADNCAIEILEDCVK